MESYPLCRQLGLLRKTRSKHGQIISSSALYDLLGQTIYKRACQHFQYTQHHGPLPGPIEAFLSQDPAAERAARAALKKEKA